MEYRYRLWVGVDWSMDDYQVCVTDGVPIDGVPRVVAKRVVEHTGIALSQFVDWLVTLSQGDPSKTAVAIEVPRGAMVESLVERGFAVFSINPKQFDRFRDRYTVAGAKDDSRDAFVLADSLRTDEPCFRRVQLDDPQVIQIRELSRMDDDLREEANRLENRLREQLHRYYPQMLALCPGVDEAWFWELLELVPTPAAATKLRQKRASQLLRKHRIRRHSASDIIAKLKAPPIHVAPGVVEAAAAHIALLLPRVRLVHAQRADCARRIEKLLDEYEAEEGQIGEHRDVDIIRSLPGVGRVVTATMLAEASQALKERDYHALRAHAGIAPVTRQSGKRRRPQVVMRQGCNTRLRNALYHWARVSSMCDERSRLQYKALRDRGHTHGRALRSVGDRVLRILVGMLKSRTLYDPTFSRRVPHPASVQVTA